jgi:Carboxypeptidase regulatory-like domain
MRDRRTKWEATSLLLGVLANSSVTAQIASGWVSGSVRDPSGLLIAAEEKTPGATSDKAYPPQLSGTVVDASGAVIAGAAVQLRRADGTVQSTTQSDRNGSFII